MSIKRVAIAFSGEGSNLERLIQVLHQKTFYDFQIEIVAAITNKPDAKGIDRAKKYGIPIIMIDHKLYENREAFDKKLVEEIEALAVDLVVLAGFMRILTPIFTKKIKAINIHPSLLPAHKGARALERSFNAEEKVVGVTAHFVVEEVDGGEIILQKSFDKSGMDFESFKEKMHACEHEIFPKAVVEVLKSLD
jgi:phosphoribosylglycinamide formyltransferase-1